VRPARAGGAARRGVELYTRLPIVAIESRASDEHDVTTTEGRIRARRVLVATNAFTGELLPELAIARTRAR
jgi:glycine/D-amino acid oxidase-like deaminating enzyme